MHGDAVDAGIGAQALDALHHVVEGVAHGHGVHEAQGHTVDVGLVADVGRIDFQRHGVAQLRGNHHGLGRRPGEQRLGHRDVEGRQQGLGLHLRQHLAPLGQHTLDQQARAFYVRLRQRRQRWWRLLQHLLVFVERSDVAERAHRRLRRAEVRNVGGRQSLPCGAHRCIAHPAGQQRLAQLRFQPGHRLGNGIRIAPGFGRVNGQQAIHSRVFGGGLQGRRVGLGGGIFGQVDQPGQGGQRRQQWLQCLCHIGRQSGQGQAEFVGPVSRQHAWTAPVSDDGQAFAHRPVTRGEAFGRRKQLDERLHPHGTGPAQSGVKHVVAAHNRAAVRLRCRIACVFASRLQYHHGFGIGGSAQGAHETARIGDALHAHDDALRLRVGGQEVEHVGNVHHGIGAQRHDGRKPDTVATRPVQDGRGQCPRLADQCQRALCRQRPSQAGVETRMRALKAQAVGAQQVQAGPPSNGFEFGRLVGPHACRHHQGGFALHAPCHLQRRRHLGVRQRDDGEVGPGVGQLGQGPGGLCVQERQLATEALAGQRRMQRLGLRLWGVTFGGTVGKHQHGSRREQGGEVVLVHGVYKG